MIAVWVSAPYGGDVATDRHQTARHSISVDKDLWNAYGDVVGDGGRAEDLRRYMEWRIRHPDEPLPGDWRGPIKKVRRRGEQPE